MTKLAILDTETSGLDKDRHEVYEIGLILEELPDADGKAPALEEWRWWLPIDLTRADPAGLRVGRYYERLPGMLAEHPAAAMTWWPNHPKDNDELATITTELARVAQTLARKLDGAHLYGICPSFDMDFLDRFLRRHGQCQTLHYQPHDVEDLAGGFLRAQARNGLAPLPAARLWEPPIDTEALCRVLGVDPEQFDKHTATGDARLVHALLHAVVDRR
jgi:DNA polymerase III epsilon subunit-like protein